jgi:hypothetical protein
MKASFLLQAFITLLLVHFLHVVSAQNETVAEAVSGHRQLTENDVNQADKLLLIDNIPSANMVYTYSIDSMYFIVSEKNSNEKNFRVYHNMEIIRTTAIKSKILQNDIKAVADYTFSYINYELFTQHFSKEIMLGLSPQYSYDLFSICNSGQPYKINEYFIDGRKFLVKIKTPYFVMRIFLDKMGCVKNVRKSAREISESKRLKELVNYGFLKEYEKIEDFKDYTTQ